MCPEIDTINTFEQDVLLSTDSLIYLETDVLFTRPPEDLWKVFNKFNASQLAALAHEGENTPIGWYNKFALHPYYGQLGINSGVMLMNLTRMRKINWSDMVLKIFRMYKPALLSVDQDILNIIFYFHPGNINANS